LGLNQRKLAIAKIADLFLDVKKLIWELDLYEDVLIEDKQEIFSVYLNARKISKPEQHIKTELQQSRNQKNSYSFFFAQCINPLLNYIVIFSF
jgi:hypothetical protein